ncbi:MAG: tetraacyldisaccharide 4'-kinase [Bacteroidales bacterium]|jgi:tetraacyldisaccharide 4'-kinase|nr:tetraacyldisaccharide 4'-kinase [Bacteroidales bacterium]MCI2121122.1 tetraacyldisaccharide 4'-kinase [Bacteroidales bacterium]MCI2144937.1 tetraacyldisaccharide 4'-kinase [Bacteroidales bacterium]
MSAFVNKVFLFPYYITLKIRHALYDSGRRKAAVYDIPVICIGNVTVGGTGKTPMVEEIIRELQDRKRLAVVSLGYKRKKRGMIFVREEDNAKDVGDEPLQIKRKFPNVSVVVCKNRNQAIEALLAMDELSRPETIILDDGLQYLKVRPSRSIVLVDYNRPTYNDSLLPFGRLRDLPERVRKADAVIVTKCPEWIDPWEREKWRKKLRLKTDTPLIFSKMIYEKIVPVWPDFADTRYVYSKEACVFTGIASDKPLRLYLLGDYKVMASHSFGDHHYYSRKDLNRIGCMAESHPLSILVTTEKDRLRLVDCKNAPDTVKLRSFYIPIRTGFLEEDDRNAFRSMLKKGAE